MHQTSERPQQRVQMGAAGVDNDQVGTLAVVQRSQRIRLPQRLCARERGRVKDLFGLPV